MPTRIFSLFAIFFMQLWGTWAQVTHKACPDHFRHDIPVVVITAVEQIDKILAGSHTLEMSEDWKDLETEITYDLNVADPSV